MFRWIAIGLLVIIAVLLGALVWLHSRSGPPVSTAAPTPEAMSSEPNTTVIIEQSAINDLLKAIFPVEGHSKLSKPVEIPYDWRVENAEVELTAEGPILKADARVHILGQSHLLKAEGKGQIRYDSTAREMFLELHELRATTDAKVLGIPLDRLNLAPSALNIRLLRHLPLFTNFRVKKPDWVREEVQFAVASHRIRYEKGRVVVDLRLRFAEESQFIADSSKQAQSK